MFNPWLDFSYPHLENKIVLRYSLYMFFYPLVFGLVVMGLGCTENQSTVTSNYLCNPPNDLAEDFGRATESCTAMPTDYTQDLSKRTANIQGTSVRIWPACVMDSEATWKLTTSDTPGSISRTANFDTIRELLNYSNGQPPSVENFITARTTYSIDKGIASRVARRTDYHLTRYPPTGPNGQDAINETGPCALEDKIPPECLDACVGPRRLLPILRDAFAKGGPAQGEAQVLPRNQAARVEAALIWFFYASIYSEIHTARQEPDDADSAWAYYTGDGGVSSPKGLAAYIQPLSNTTHSRIWDGLRALRCWRSYVGDDKSIRGPVQDSDDDIRWKTARNQLDRAVLHGLSLIVSDRVGKILEEQNNDIRAAHWAFVQTLAPVFDRGARATGHSNEANRLRQIIEKPDFAQVSNEDLNTIKQVLAVVFPCP